MKKTDIINRILCLILCFVLSGFCIGCEKTDSKEEVLEKEEAIQIGVVFDSLVIERWERDRDVFVSRARELGAEVNVQNANGDVETQISQIEYFIQKKVDAIVIVATDCDRLKDEVARAHKAGIKVISYDRLISNADTDLYISFDNNRVGELMGEGIVAQTEGQGDILMINGPLTDTNVPTVMEGFESIIGPSEINIVETDFCEGWKSEYAFDYVSNYISEHPEEAPVAIMCGNDSLAGQAVKALAENKLAGTVIVTGQDADLDACQRIVEGTQYMTVYKPVEKLARRAADMTIELIQNGYVKVNETRNDGTYDVPYESLDPIQVTAQNMEEVIIGSFHQKSEVYLNVSGE